MRQIYIQTQFEDLHKYPKAPKGVEYLKNLHRHLFKVKVKMEIGDEDREVEFLLFKQEVDEIVLQYVKTLKIDKSCELMAETILDFLETKYIGRMIEVDVSEDGENGSIVSNVEAFSSDDITTD